MLNQGDDEDLEATLAILKPEEYPVIARYVDVIERAGWIGVEEAAPVARADPKLGQVPEARNTGVQCYRRQRLGISSR